jgi:hypothetical protein
VTKRKLFFRRLVNRMLDGLREAVAPRSDSDASMERPESDAEALQSRQPAKETNE